MLDVSLVSKTALLHLEYEYQLCLTRFQAFSGHVNVLEKYMART